MERNLIEKEKNVENNKVLIEIKNITKIYGSGDSQVIALKNINLNIYENDFIAIMGASGSGKSTLMNILGTLDVPTSGEYLFKNISIANMNDDERSELRSRYIGFVFQSFNLIKTLNVIENVQLPLFYLKEWNDKTHIKDKKNYIKQKAINLLNIIGLSNRMYYKINQLSGGQQQRVAIARALINDLEIILADEPTGNLDSKTSIEIMQIFKELNQKGKTIILVTHENDIASYAKKIIEFKDGEILNILG